MVAPPKQGGPRQAENAPDPEKAEGLREWKNAELEAVACQVLRQDGCIRQKCETLGDPR